MWQVAQVMSDSSNQMKRHIWTIAVVVVVVCCAAFFGVRGYQRRADKMHAALDSALEQNRNYVPFTSDSTMKEVVAYFDRYGTPNDRLRAHYALGCVYRDLHDAPIALLTWEDAIAAADTTSADCDYATLFRVYGQMSDIYFRQFMPEKQMEAQQKYCTYALLADDTLNYIRGLLKRNDAFLALGDTTAIIQNIEHVRALYLERGLKAEAAQVYPSAFQIALEKQQFERVGNFMRVYERESGLFDGQGNIVRSREIYYYFKGMYYLGVHQLDSAEYQFRKLLPFEENRVDAYRGLLSLYRLRHLSDSIYKYDILYEGALGDYLKQTKVEAITQAEGLYDYSRQQQIAQEKRQEAQHRGIIIILLLLTGAIGFIYLWRKKEAQELELHQTTLSYIQAQKEIDRLNDEIAFLKRHLPKQEESIALLEDKENRILQLGNMVERYKEKLGREIPQNDEESLMHSDIVKHFRNLCYIHSYKEKSIVHTIQPRACNISEWKKLLSEIQKYHFSFYYLITIDKKLPKLQHKVCILSRLGFKTNEIAILLGTSEQNISNARSRAAQKLFNSSETSLLDSKLPKT